MELPEGTRGEGTSCGEMHTFLPKLKPLSLQGPADRCTHSPHLLGVHTRILPCPTPKLYASLSNGPPPGQPAAPGALTRTNLVEFKAIKYKGGGQRRLQFPVPLLPLEWVIPKSQGGANHVKTRLDICPRSEAAHRAPGK